MQIQIWASYKANIKLNLIIHRKILHSWHPYTRNKKSIYKNQCTTETTYIYFICFVGKKTASTHALTTNHTRTKYETLLHKKFIHNTDLRESCTWVVGVLNDLPNPQNYFFLNNKKKKKTPITHNKSWISCKLAQYFHWTVYE